MRKFFSRNYFFILELIIVALIALGIIPRHAAFFILAAWILFIFARPLEDSVVLFVQSIPLFIALPVLTDFDNFNTWRIVSGLIFLKWASGKNFLHQLWRRTRIFPQDPVAFFRQHRIALLTILLFVFSILSLLIAHDIMTALRRIVYFGNVLLVPVVVYVCSCSRADFPRRLLRGVLIAGVLVALVGFVQLGMTYFMNADGFLKFWASRIETNLYGWEWGNIALNANTWFAYFGEQFSLRMFSNFPDSHSFPIFLILTLPALLAFSVKKNNKLLPTGYSLLAIILLAIILSGTRGIWLAFLAPIATTLWFWKGRFKEYAKRGGILVLIFLVVFAISWFIFSTPQFQLAHDNDLIKGRLKSIIDASELSNNGRILIWKATLQSIVSHPWLGVGIGNFPIVLGKDVELGRAGATAHNLYLHVFAEMGIGAGIVFVWLLWEIFRGMKNKISAWPGDNPDTTTPLSAFNFLLSFSWILLYSLTDAALFDERAFLMFASVTACMLALTIVQKPKHSIGRQESSIELP